MRKYYLVARYTQDNSLDIIKLNKKWYNKANEDEFSKANSLEAIDLITTRFSSPTEMIKRMGKKYLKSSDVDLFIAYKKNETELFFYEIIYNTSSNINNFREIAKASLEQEYKSVQEQIQKIYEKLAYQLFNNYSYQKYYQKDFYFLNNCFKNLYDDCESIKDFLEVPYINHWMLSNYLMIREAVRNLEKSITKGNCSRQREEIVSKLLKKMDINYVDGQYDLFDLGLKKS